MAPKKGHVSRMEEDGNSVKILTGKRPLGVDRKPILELT
jgi:hypothetical protein